MRRGSVPCTQLLPTLVANYRCQVYTGRPPFADVSNEAQIILGILSGKRPSRPASPDEAMSDSLWEIAQECWLEAPESRPSISQVSDRILAHETCHECKSTIDGSRYRVRSSDYHSINGLVDSCDDAVPRSFVRLREHLCNLRGRRHGRPSSDAHSHDATRTSISQ